MLSDININQSAKLVNISEIADYLGLTDSVELYGSHKAKINLTHEDISGPLGKLILVTAITPTPAGEGKTTTTIGLADALQHLGKKTVVCLREPALGPVFGMKGGATGGGYSQVAPMVDINLHFTGDFAAIASAHNLLAALVDNHIYHGNELDISKVTWRRVIDMNDRSLREGFDIVVASEVMAILCLVDNLQDLITRLGNITVGYTSTGTAVYARDLAAEQAMTVLLKDAIKPNLVQTLEHTPAIIHGGPFANIAHGCNSVIATKLGLKLADYVVTEAGFASDLGAEKFVNIKCRKSGLVPDAAVVVATIRALKHHGHGILADGFANLAKHVENVSQHFGIPTVVAINRFSDDTADEIAELVDYIEHRLGVPAAVCDHWAHGSAGAINLATIVTALADQPSNFHYAYSDTDTLFEKIEQIAKQIYGAAEVVFPLEVTNLLHKWQREGLSHYPICMAKTPASLSSDPTLRGAPTGFTVWVDSVEIRSGAGFVVVKMGKILTLPGLPRQPNSTKIKLLDNGNVSGIS